MLGFEVSGPGFEVLGPGFEVLGPGFEENPQMEPKKSGAVIKTRVKRSLLHFPRVFMCFLPSGRNGVQQGGG